MWKVIAYFSFFSVFQLLGANEFLEIEFQERLFSFVENEDMSQKELLKVWNIQDSPFQERSSTFESLERMVLKKIKTIDFVDIDKKMALEMAKSFEIDGESYLINLTPYKRIVVKFNKVIKGASSSYSTIVGIKDEKLYIVDLKKIAEDAKGSVP